MQKLKPLFAALFTAFQEALICLGLGFKASLRPGVMLRSSALCIAVSCLFLWLFQHYYKEIGYICLLAAGFVAFSLANFALLPVLFNSSGAMDGGPVLVDPFRAFNLMYGLASFALYFIAYAVLFFLLLYGACVLLGARVGMHWRLLARVRERSRTHYPQLPPVPHDGRSLLKVAGCWPAPWLGVPAWTLWCLLIPVFNGLLLLLGLAYLNIRFLMPSALAGLASREEQLAVITARRGSMAILGLLLLAVAFVPVLNLLLPGMLGASVCHLGNRALGQLRERNGDSACTSCPGP